MNNDEIERRIALKKMFQERLNMRSIEPDVPYVSKLVKIEIDDKKEKSTKQKEKKPDVNKIKKECFEPIVEIDETNLEYSGSKYFGKVWLSNGEKWPQNSQGEYLIFILQLNISTLPEKYKNDLGGKGLIQFFFDSEYDGESLIRIVYPNENGQYHEQPMNKDDFNNYLIENEKPKQKIIKSWKSEIDFPHYEEILDEEMENIVEELRDQSEDSENEEEICAIQGDKLGGYAFWTQAGESSENLLYQIDAGCFYDGKSFEAHAPELFAGDGTAHIFYNKEDKTFYFDWACG